LRVDVAVVLLGQWLAGEAVNQLHIMQAHWNVNSGPCDLVVWKSC